MAIDVMQQMAEHVAVGRRGDRTDARRGLERLWHENADADPVTKCGIAHALADVQDDAARELEWDIVALANALDATDADVERLGMAGGVAGLMPSLHLNLADAYRRLGLSDVATGHAFQARSALGSVDANPYFQSIDEAITRLLQRLQSGRLD